MGGGPAAHALALDRAAAIADDEGFQSPRRGIGGKAEPGLQDDAIGQAKGAGNRPSGRCGRNPAHSGFRTSFGPQAVRAVGDGVEADQVRVESCSFRATGEGARGVPRIAQPACFTQARDDVDELDLPASHRGGDEETAGNEETKRGLPGGRPRGKDEDDLGRARGWGRGMDEGVLDGSTDHAGGFQLLGLNAVFEKVQTVGQLGRVGTP